MWFLAKVWSSLFYSFNSFMNGIIFLFSSGCKIMCPKADNLLISCRHTKKRHPSFSLCVLVLFSLSHSHACTQIDAERFRLLTVQLEASDMALLSICLCSGYPLIQSMLTASLYGAAHSVTVQFAFYLSPLVLLWFCLEHCRPPTCPPEHKLVSFY